MHWLFCSLIVQSGWIKDKCQHGSNINSCNKEKHPPNDSTKWRLHFVAFFRHLFWSCFGLVLVSFWSCLEASEQDQAKSRTRYEQDHNKTKRKPVKNCLFCALTLSKDSIIILTKGLVIAAMAAELSIKIHVGDPQSILARCRNGSAFC